MQYNSCATLVSLINILTCMHQNIQMSKVVAANHAFPLEISYGKNNKQINDLNVVHSQLN